MFAVVTTAQANVRTGPGTEFDSLIQLAMGVTLDVVGSDAGQNWWHVCCVDGALGWISSSEVTLYGDRTAVPTSLPLLPEDLVATWALRWECRADGCPQEECLGESRAEAVQVRSDRWLEVQRTTTWQDACGEDEAWLSQVDRYSGQEQQTEAVPPLFGAWAGADPGPESRIIELNGRVLSLWCTDTRTREVDQGDGWTIRYEGEACYDRAAGVLITLQYLKQWLFSGTVGDQTYERQYFGDYEVIQQILLDTNAPLSGQ